MSDFNNTSNYFFKKYVIGYMFLSIRNTTVMLGISVK